MSISLFADTYTDKPAEKLHDIRFIGAIRGCYSLNDRRDGADNKAKVFACRTQSISPKRFIIDAPVRGNIGERVSAKLDEFEIINGTIAQVLNAGLIIDITATDAERTKIASKIDWVKKNKLRAFKDKRIHKRVMPPNPQSAITLGDGSIVECFVIDVSQSGVAVSADIMPELGTRLAIGRAVGVVVRYLDVGFAVRFCETLNLDEVDAVFGWSLDYLKKGEGKDAEATENSDEEDLESASSAA